MNYIEHTFGAKETIVAIIKLKNRMDLTPIQINKLLIRFNHLNGVEIPKPGQLVKIPLLE